MPSTGDLQQDHGHAVREIMVFLHGHGVGPARAVLIYTGIPQMTPELAWMVAIFWIAGSPDPSGGRLPAFQASPNGVRGV